VSQEKEKERMTTDTCGTKPLELLENANLSGSLAKMWKALLTSPMVQSCSRYNKTWKKRVSKSNVVLFQLQASVLGIREKESGLSDAMFQTPTTQDARIGPNNIGGNKHRMKRGSIALADQILFQTPTATEIPMRSKEAMEKRKKYRESIGRKTVPPGNLLEQIQMMYPTPKARDHFSAVDPTQVTMNSKGWTSTRKGTGVRYGANLPDVVNKLYPTPTARDYKDAAYQPHWKESRDKSLPREILKNNKPGGKLNPHFVEFLMAYPMNWTKIEPTE
jgi:hypothetical protein